MENYEIKLEKNKKRNEKYLKKFESWLNNKGLVKKTIRKHLSNTELYLDSFLTYYDITKMEDGINEVDTFFSDWFIRKCMWSSKNSIKETAASIKKFYQCMSEHNYVNKEDYKILCEEIKDNMEFWLESLEEYDNGTYFDIF